MRRFASAAWLICLACVVVFGAPLARADEPAAKRVLLLGQGPDGHPPGTHEFMAGLKVLDLCLRKHARLSVTVVNAGDPWPEGPALLKEADAVVLYLSEGAKWMKADPRRWEALLQAAERKTGFVGVHWAIGAKPAETIENSLRILGGCHGGPDRRYVVLPEARVLVAGPDHPIVAGVADFQTREELYFRLKFTKAEPGPQPVLQSRIEDNLETVAWAWERPDGGRSFGYSGGHFHDNWGRQEYRRLLTQAVLWSLRLEVPKAGVDVDVPEESLRLK